MDACELTFADESFDLVYSIASFEHIHDLPRALARIRRVLKPGGLLVSVWSPIWNGFNGHHYGSTLSHPDHRDIALPWAHHILSPERMREYLTAGESFSPQEADRAVEFIFDSPWLNRLGYRDYVRILDASPLKRLTMEGVRVDFAGLLRRVEEKITAGYVKPEELIGFFKRTPEEEVLVYKIRAVLRR
jgi:SAM-dependent methyltransferase